MTVEKMQSQLFDALIKRLVAQNINTKEITKATADFLLPFRTRTTLSLGKTDEYGSASD